MKNLADTAQKIFDSGAETVLICSIKHDAVFLAKKLFELDPERKKFKSIFMTVGPTQGDWIDVTKDAGKYITSGGQWDANSERCGDWFHNGWPEKRLANYCSKNWNKHVEEWMQKNVKNAPAGYKSDYETASGAVAFYTMIDAVYQAHRNVRLTPGKAFDQEIVREALRLYEGQTFFGGVEFNRIQRNIGNEPVAIQ